MNFGKLKKKSKIKYKAFYCLEIQPQRFKADNLSCLILDYKRLFFDSHNKFDFIDRELCPVSLTITGWHFTILRLYFIKSKPPI